MSGSSAYAPHSIPADAPEKADGEAELLLYALQSPINLGMILRVAETYRFGVSIYDRHRVFDNPEKLRTAQDFACGAMSRRALRRFTDEESLERMLVGRRLIATSIGNSSCELTSYEFRPCDLFALGNEYDGLPESVIGRADTV